jgi:hypothetical protein
MAWDASAALGAPQVAGSVVNPRGLGRKMTGMALGGLVGSAVAGMGNKNKQPGNMPNIGKVGFLAVSGNDVALVKTKSGLWKMKLTDELLARRSRSEIVSSELKGGMMVATLSINFTDGDVWSFDVPRARKKSAKQVLQALGGVER